MTSLAGTRNIHAIGRNYMKHIQELGNQITGEPVLFSKSVTTMTSARELHFPKALAPIHYELELVLRIGRDVPVGVCEGVDCVSHMALGIDFTARELQSKLKREGLPWFRAKNFRDATWVGPLSKGIDLTLPFRFHLERNGELRQDGDSRRMIFPFHQLLMYLNSTIPLQEGDLVFTGTPAGVGPIADGDQLRVICPDLATDETLTIHLL